MDDLIHAPNAAAESVTPRPASVFLTVAAALFISLKPSPTMLFAFAMSRASCAVSASILMMIGDMESAITFSPPSPPARRGP